jgi:hypothetical protein
MTAGCFALLNSNNKRMSVSVVATRFSGKGRSHPRSIADFYADVMRSLAELGINIRINELPNEIPDAIRFSEDRGLHVARAGLQPR